MRVLMVHNFYQQWGGEDQSTQEELRLLRQYGHEVESYTRHSDDIKKFSKPRMALLFFEPTWSLRTYRELSETIQRFKPDIIHCQNFFMLVSPSLYYAAAKYNVPVVQSLRNFRLMCPTGVFFRDGHICEECPEHSLLRSIKYGCYHSSKSQTASIALMLKTHRLLHTWETKVHGYIALTEFVRQKYIHGGLPSEKIVVRPNFIGNIPAVSHEPREYALYVGRLSLEKGVKTLIMAWRHIPDLPLKLLGTGDLLLWAQDYIQQHNMSNVKLVGFVNPNEVMEYQCKAKVLVMPSLCYETFGRVILEAYAVGTPSIVSNLGAMAEVVDDGKTGLLFAPGDAQDLACKVRYAIDHPDLLAEWGRNARAKLETRYSIETAHNRLIDIYQQVIKRQPVLK